MLNHCRFIFYSVWKSLKSIYPGNFITKPFLPVYREPQHCGGQTFQNALIMRALCWPLFGLNEALLLFNVCVKNCLFPTNVQWGLANCTLGDILFRWLYLEILCLCVFSLASRITNELVLRPLGEIQVRVNLKIPTLCLWKKQSLLC